MKAQGVAQPRPVKTLAENELHQPPAEPNSALGENRSRMVVLVRPPLAVHVPVPPVPVPTPVLLLDRFGQRGATPRRETGQELRPALRQVGLGPLNACVGDAQAQVLVQAFFE